MTTGRAQSTRATRLVRTQPRPHRIHEAEMCIVLPIMPRILIVYILSRSIAPSVGRATWQDLTQIHDFDLVPCRAVPCWFAIADLGFVQHADAFCAALCPLLPDLRAQL